MARNMAMLAAQVALGEAAVVITQEMLAVLELLVRVMLVVKAKVTQTLVVAEVAQVVLAHLVPQETVLQVL